jgi:hypothetical protein
MARMVSTDPSAQALFAPADQRQPDPLGYF